MIKKILLAILLLPTLLYAQYGAGDDYCPERIVF
jgi:hypothetical protein